MQKGFQLPVGFQYEGIIEIVVTYSFFFKITQHVKCQLFWGWRRNILALGVNTMPADALATLGASASAGMVLGG